MKHFLCTVSYFFQNQKMTAESVHCTFNFKLCILNFLVITYCNVDGDQARLLDYLQRKFLKVLSSGNL